MIHFDPTFSIGTIINIASFFLGAFWFVRRIERRLLHTEWRVSLMWRSFCHDKNIAENTDEQGLGT